MKCQRCGSSMLLDVTDIVEAWQQVWKCLGCGRETLVDPERRAEDERMLAGIIRQGPSRPGATF